jgi:glyoxylase-like metal-dependent hydrolase (beta-lactamase superfamily II)
MDDLEERVFGELPDETWVYPGHGDDTRSATSDARSRSGGPWLLKRGPLASRVRFAGDHRTAGDAVQTSMTWSMSARPTRSLALRV